MANGPQHYARAEQILRSIQQQLEKALEEGRGTTPSFPAVEVGLKMAAVHAQLADVALRYDSAPPEIRYNEDWYAATDASKSVYGD